MSCLVSLFLLFIVGIWLWDVISSLPNLVIGQLIMLLIFAYYYLKCDRDSTKFKCIGVWFLFGALSFLIYGLTGADKADRNISFNKYSHDPGPIFEWKMALFFVFAIGLMGYFLHLITSPKPIVVKVNNDFDKAKWRADLEAKRKEKEKTAAIKSSTETKRTIQKNPKSRIEMAMDELKYVPKENLEYAAVNTAIKYGIATSVLLSLVQKKNSNLISGTDKQFLHDYLAADPDSYDYMLSKGLDPHDKNLHLSEDDRLDLLDDLYYRDEDDIDEDFDDLDDYDDFHDHSDYSHHDRGLFGSSHDDDSFWRDHDDYCDHGNHDHDW